MTVSRELSMRIGDVDESQWHDLLARFDDASIYQSWAFGAECWSEQQLAHCVLWEADRPVALSQVRLILVPFLGAGVAYVRWGPIARRQGHHWDADAWMAMMEGLVREYGVRRGLLLRVLPQTFAQETHAEEVQRQLASLGFRADRAERPYHTFRISLELTEDELRRALSSRWRRQLSIGERNGLTVEEGQSPELYSRFVRLYDEMMARKRFHTTVDVNDFGRMQARLPERHKMLVFLAYLGEELAAGLVVSLLGDTSIYLLAATGDAGLDARGSYVLQWHAMRRLKALGLRWYDLGGANEAANPGVFTFKAGMGGEAVHQLGRFDRPGGAISTGAVLMGEGLRRLRAAWRDRTPETGSGA